ncbi:tRNA (guanosine(46)-N7)-methyltransferase TrmB [Rhodohalobacter mucosus]|uniref:tRNA (guanine-N(7)-)-methyltransferase n=1 Tax=Rhodohalobacter mucosus TaxID=2079485 RepID=A0A316TU32_9BACT|nr:tRNA (guanosine(46)-N7)-methyltransferase TrmB [Rhodohalobacter mucosus]PWN08073.1 tRNA (guanosine(46)-N7)-methyltransferase TrmB [Rhodohalobacter mucosus]
MAKNKLQKFEDVARFQNVFEYTDFDEKTKPRGCWHGDIFKNENPITLELACGKGEYTVELARRNPERNYIGIDKKGWRIWTGAKTAIEENLNNAHFMRIFIDHLEEYFKPGEVDEIWIVFPDPFLRESRESNRLTSPKFLNIYKNILKPGSVIHLKTDSPELFSYTLEVIEQENCRIVDRCDNIYKERPDDALLSIRTFYEEMHLREGRTIRYVSFQLP